MKKWIDVTATMNTLKDVVIIGSDELQERFESALKEEDNINV